MSKVFFVFYLSICSVYVLIKFFIVSTDYPDNIDGWVIVTV
jgi:hypothetical protein